MNGDTRKPSAGAVYPLSSDTNALIGVDHFLTYNNNYKETTNINNNLICGNSRDIVYQHQSLHPPGAVITTDSNSASASPIQSCGYGHFEAICGAPIYVPQSLLMPANMSNHQQQATGVGGEQQQQQQQSHPQIVMCDQTNYANMNGLIAPAAVASNASPAASVVTVPNSTLIGVSSTSQGGVGVPQPSQQQEGAAAAQEYYNSSDYNSVATNNAIGGNEVVVMENNTMAAVQSYPHENASGGSDNASIESNQIPLEQLKQMLSSQLEYYFSRENLASDTYLITQMDNDQYVPIWTVANFNQVKKLTKDLNLITEVLRESTNVQVDEDGLRVRPNHKRCIVILREIPETTPLEQVQSIFVGENCPRYVSCEFAHNNAWYITFETDDDAKEAFKYLREEVKMFLGKPIMARIKAKPMNRMNIAPNPNPIKNGFTTPPPSMYDPNTAYQNPRIYANGTPIPQQALPQYNTLFLQQQPFYTMAPWPPAAPTSQNYYDMGSVFSANNLAPQLFPPKSHNQRFYRGGNIRKQQRANNVDHRQHQVPEQLMHSHPQSPHQQQHQQQQQPPQGHSMSNHRSMHNHHHHMTYTTQAGIQQQQPVSVSAAGSSSSAGGNPMSNKSQLPLAHGATNSNIYVDQHYYATKSNKPQTVTMPKDDSKSHPHVHHHVTHSQNSVQMGGGYEVQLHPQLLQYPPQQQHPPQVLQQSYSQPAQLHHDSTEISVPPYPYGHHNHHYVQHHHHNVKPIVGDIEDKSHRQTNQSIDGGATNHIGSNIVTSTTSGGGNGLSSNSSSSGSKDNSKDWSRDFRRRRRVDDISLIGISGGGRQSISSGGNGGGPNGNISGGYKSLTSPIQSTSISSRSPDAQYKSGNVGNNGGSLQQTSSNKATAQFDLEPSAFPPLPGHEAAGSPLARMQNNHQSNALSSNVNKTVSNTVEAGNKVGDNAGKPIGMTTPIVTPTWGENRLADVVRGTTKSKTKGINKEVNANAPVSNASISISPPLVNTTVVAIATSSSTDATATNTAVVEKPPQGSLTNCVAAIGVSSSSSCSPSESMSTKTQSNVVVAVTQQQSPDNQNAATKTSPASSSSDVVVIVGQSLVQSINKTNPPVITADKATKTDQSLHNVVDLKTSQQQDATTANNTSAIIATNINNNTTTINTPVSSPQLNNNNNINCPATASVATMTTAEILLSSSNMPALGAPKSQSAATMTTVRSVTQQQPQLFPPQSKAKTAQKSHNHLHNPSLTAATSTLTLTAAPMLSPATSPQPGNNVFFNSLAGNPPLLSTPPIPMLGAATVATPNEGGGASSVRLSYAQVAQHSKERLSKEKQQTVDNGVVASASAAVVAAAIVALPNDVKDQHVKQHQSEKEIRSGGGYKKEQRTGGAQHNDVKDRSEHNRDHHRMNGPRKERERKVSSNSNSGSAGNSSVNVSTRERKGSENADLNGKGRYNKMNHLKDQSQASRSSN